MKTNALDKLNRIAIDESSQWLKKAKWREENRDWLDKSAIIAIKILRELRSQNLSQKDLAERIGVTPQYINKIVKGQENLSLETINKLEKALGITLLAISEVNQEGIEVTQSSIIIEPDFQIFEDTITIEEVLSSIQKPTATIKKKISYSNFCSEYNPEEKSMAA